MDEPVMGAEIIVSDVYGDVNGDGELNIADAVYLQNFLLGRTAAPADWRKADLCQDDRLDAFDLTLLRQMLIEK